MTRFCMTISRCTVDVYAEFVASFFFFLFPFCVQETHEEWREIRDCIYVKYEECIHVKQEESIMWNSADNSPEHD